MSEEVKEVIERYGKGHLIATTACMGGELSTNALAMVTARELGDNNTAGFHYNKIVEFMEFCIDMFGDGFGDKNSF